MIKNKVDYCLYFCVEKYAKLSICFKLKKIFKYLYYTS